MIILYNILYDNYMIILENVLDKNQVFSKTKNITWYFLNFFWSKGYLLSTLFLKIKLYIF